MVNHLEIFSKDFTDYLNKYLKEKKITGRFYTPNEPEIEIIRKEDLSCEKHQKLPLHKLSWDLHLRDILNQEGLYVGKYTAHFLGNEKYKEEFSSHFFFSLFENLHLNYENGVRKDSHLEIPFPG